MPHRVQELRLPVLEGRGQELGPEVGPSEGLAVLLGVIALRNELGAELACQREQEQGGGDDAEAVGLGEAGFAEVVVVQVAAVGPLSGGHGSSLPIRDRNGFVMPEQLPTESNRERRWV